MQISSPSVQTILLVRKIKLKLTTVSDRSWWTRIFGMYYKHSKFQIHEIKELLGTLTNKFYTH